MLVGLLEGVFVGNSALLAFSSSLLDPLILTLTTSVFQCLKILKGVSTEVCPLVLGSILTDLTPML